MLLPYLFGNCAGCLDCGRFESILGAGEEIPSHLSLDAAKRSCVSYVKDKRQSIYGGIGRQPPSLGMISLPGDRFIEPGSWGEFNWPVPIVNGDNFLIAVIRQWVEEPAGVEADSTGRSVSDKNIELLANDPKWARAVREMCTAIEKARLDAQDFWEDLTEDARQNWPRLGMCQVPERKK